MSYQFKPAFLTNLFFFIVILVLVILGSWQLNHADEKKLLQQMIDERSLQEPLSLNMPFDEFSPYQLVQASGNYRPKDSILLNNIEYQGKPGFHLITPFEILASRAVIMVNRGWLAQGKSRDELPTFKTPEGLITLEGHLAPPGSKPALASTTGQPIAPTPPLWYYMDQQFFSQIYGYSILPLMLNLRTGGQTSTYHSTRIPESDSDTPLILDWPEYDAKSGMHTRYATQWFVFALIALIAYLGVSFKKLPRIK